MYIFKWSSFVCYLFIHSQSKYLLSVPQLFLRNHVARSNYNKSKHSVISWGVYSLGRQIKTHTQILKESSKLEVIFRDGEKNLLRVQSGQRWLHAGNITGVLTKIKGGGAHLSLYYALKYTITDRDWGHLLRSLGTHTSLILSSPPVLFHMHYYYISIDLAFDSSPFNSKCKTLCISFSYFLLGILSNIPDYSNIKKKKCYINI